MKKISFLILLLAGIPAAAQHPIPPERQALIRRVAVPILADTLKTAAGRSSKSFSTNYNYKADIFGSARMEYGLQDDLVYLRWPLQISVTVNEGWGNKNDYAWADYSGLTGQCDYTTELVGDKRLKKKPTDTLLAWLLYVGGYRIREEKVFPKKLGGSIVEDTANEDMKLEGSLWDIVRKQVPSHNRKAEKSGRIWEITDFDTGSLTLRAAVQGGGPATLQRVWEADPYVLVFALAFDMSVHFYLYDSAQVGQPQEALFSAAEIVKAVKEMK